MSESPHPATASTPPGVSVVIPAYNYARFLPSAVESCLKQDYPNFEVVVIDDGSKDNTREVMANYGPPVRYVHQTNAGLSAARNTGIREAKFEFVAFLDADDLLLPTHLSDSMAAFAKLPTEYALVACDDMLVDVDEKPLPFTVHVPVLPREITVKDILMRTRFSPTGAVARKEVFTQCGGFDTTLRSTEDRDMWIRIAARRRIWHQGKVLVQIRKHGNNMSNNADRMKNNMAAVLKKSYAAQVWPKADVCFWLQVFSYWRYQTSLIYNGIKQPARAFRDLFISVLLWPFFLNPAANGNKPLFRLRSFLRYTLNAIRGEVKT
ncbi:MAG: glycosyltransferase family 2 protein [Proteobacteria bacterium]|nr:glycosyltransferase family 2 protein [Pseudomonadota bacterium]